MKGKNRRPSVRLSTIMVMSIAVAVIAAVSVCIAVFAPLYSSALFRDAQVNSEQIIGQTKLAVNNNFESMRNKLALIRDIAEKA